MVSQPYYYVYSMIPYELIVAICACFLSMAEQHSANERCMNIQWDPCSATDKKRVAFMKYPVGWQSGN